MARLDSLNDWIQALIDASLRHWAGRIAWSVGTVAALLLLISLPALVAVTL